VDDDGLVYLVNKQGYIFQHEYFSNWWRQIPGLANDVVAKNGKVYIASNDGVRELIDGISWSTRHDMPSL